VTAAPTPTPSPASVAPWIVYQWGYDDGNALFLVHEDGTGNHRLLPSLPARDKHPDWSPDGSRIAFIWIGEQDHIDIREVPVEGGDPTVLVPCTAPCLQAGGPAWSADGTKLAYAEVDLPAGADGWFSIRVLDVATGATTIVARGPTFTPEVLLEYGRPRWSPDGRSIAFQTTAWTPPDAAFPSGGEILTVPADGSAPGRPTVLVKGSMMAAYPDWSPDGAWIVFDTYDEAWFGETTEPANLYRIRADGSDLTPITTFPANGPRANHPTWTPDGTRIVFTHFARGPEVGAGGDRRIAFIDPDGTGLVVLEDGPNGMHPRDQPSR
jgi:Tol biopolymer transport system component